MNEQPDLWIRIAALDGYDGWDTLVEWAQAEYERREHEILSGALTGEELKYIIGQANVLKCLVGLPEEARSILKLRGPMEVQDLERR